MARQMSAYAKTEEIAMPDGKSVFSARLFLRKRPFSSKKARRYACNAVFGAFISPPACSGKRFHPMIKPHQAAVFGGV